MNDHDALLELARKLGTLVTEFNANRIRFLDLCFAYMLNKDRYPREWWLRRFDFTDEELSRVDRYELLLDDEFEQFRDVRYRRDQSKRGKRGAKHKKTSGEEHRADVAELYKRGLST